MKKTFNTKTHLWSVVIEDKPKPKKRREKMVMTPTNETETKVAENAISEQAGE